MARYLDPSNDYAFKKLFRDKDRLLDLLNNIFKVTDGRKIVDLEYEPLEMMPLDAQGKKVLFDLRVKDETGKTYVVEMQRKNTFDYLDRVQFYGSRISADQLQAGQAYKRLLPVIIISFIGGKLFPDEIDCINEHILVEKKSQKQFLSKITYIFIELGKVDKTKVGDDVNGWLHLLTCAATENIVPPEIHNKNILCAYETLEQSLWSPGELDYYVRVTLTQDMEDAMRQEAIEESLAKGKAEGLEEGKAEAKREIAKRLISLGLPDHIVLESSEISPDELAGLKKTTL